MSGLSAQPACRKDGVDLPRVIFSSPGPSDEERFRPSFTLCPDNHNINHIEVGEDINPSHDQKMGDVNSPPTGPNFRSISEFDTGDLGVVSTNNNDKHCQNCHGPATTTPPPPNGEKLSVKIFPSDVFVGTFHLAPCVLATNDPDVIPPPGGTCPISFSETKSTTPTPLSAICDSIESSTALASDPNVNFTLEIQLCERLDGKTQSN
jgi:hypothetical protein